MSIEKIIGLLLFLFSTILILYFLLKKNEPFFNLRNVLVEHLSLFKNCKSQYFVFYFLPLLLSVGLSLIVTVNINFFSHMGVVLSVVLSMLLALMSILTNYDYSMFENESQHKRAKMAVKQTINAILFCCFIGIIMLLLGFAVLAVDGKDLSWIPFDVNLCKILFSTFTYYCLCVILLTLLLIIKNISKIIEVNMTIERKKK